MKTKRNIRPLLFIYFVILIGFVLIAARLYQLQVLDHDTIQAESDKLIIRHIELPAKRGNIVDKNGNLLAYSIDTFNVVFSRLKSEDLNEEIKKLFNAYSNFDQQEIIEKIKQSEDDEFIIIEDIPRKDVKLVQALGVKAIRVDKLTKRIYPNDSLAAHILGYTDIDGLGQHGLEYTQNEFLAGKIGKIIARTDLLGRRLAMTEADVVEPINGYTIKTTIDQTIQFYVEQAIMSGCKISNAIKVMAIVQDSRNGDILAMASYPSFDPNDKMLPISDIQRKAIEDRKEGESVYDVMSKYWNNPLTQDLYEPGSTFKIFTGLVGLEEGVTSNETSYYCPGYQMVSGQRIKCWKSSGHGTQTLVEGFQNSCNVVFMEVIRAIGKEKVYEYLKAFHLDEKTSIPLNGEASPFLTPIEKSVPVDLARVGFGHGISLTPLEMMNVLSVVSNHGELYAPRLIDSIIDDSGEVVQSIPHRSLGQVVSAQTADSVLATLETVVSEGSGKNAYISGYKIGGKTGTATKLINGGYPDDKKVFSSFAAVVPTDDPVFNIIVIVDEPKTDNVHGSTVATPIVREIILNILQYLRIDPNVDVQYEMATAPNFIGMTAYEAEIAAQNVGIVLVNSDGIPLKEADGASTVDKQYPLEGTLISQGGEVYIKLKIN